MGLMTDGLGRNQSAPRTQVGVPGSGTPGKATPRPPHPWSDPENSARSLVEWLGRLLCGQDDVLASRVRSGADRPSLVENLVRRHRLGPYLHRRLASSPLATSLPASTIERIQSSAIRQEQISARCLEGLEGLGERFEAAGLVPILIKGPALAIRLYGGVAARGYWDLDLLVRASDRVEVCRLLDGCGFTRLSATPLGERLTARFHHAFDYASGAWKLDLHWSLSRLPGLQLDEPALFARAEQIELAGRRWAILADEDELTALMLGSFADIARGYLRLQSFVDLFAWLERNPGVDWPAWLQRRRHERTERIARQVLGLFLASLGLESRFPALVADLGPRPTREQACAVLAPSRAGWRGKRWAARGLPVSPGRYAGWWLVSLPLRVAASHPGFRRPQRG